MKAALLAAALFVCIFQHSRANASDWRWYHVQFVSPWSNEVVLKSGAADVSLSAGNLSVRFLGSDGGGRFTGRVDSAGGVNGIENGFDPDGFPQRYRGLMLKNKVDLPDDVIVDDEERYRSCFNRSVLVENDSGSGQVIVLSEISKCAQDIMALPIRDD